MVGSTSDRRGRSALGPRPDRVSTGRPARMVVVYLFGSLGGMLFGYDFGVISGALLFIRRAMPMNNVVLGIAVSALPIGAVIGGAFGGRIADRLGRRYTILLSALVFSVGTLVSAVAPDPTIFVVGRVIVGLGIGGSASVVPVYLSELAPARRRGTLSALSQLMVLTGMLLAYFVDYLFSFSGNWRAMIGVALIPGAVLLVAMFAMPESPRWLVAAGRVDAARGTLRMLRPGEDIEPEVDGIRRIVADSASPRRALAELFSRRTRPILLLVLGLAAAQQFCGVSAINLYAPTMFQNLRLGASDALLASVGLAAVKLVLGVGSVLLVDRWGRRPLLIAGSLVMAATMAVLGFVLLVYGSTPSSAAATFALLVGYLAGYEIGWGAVVWILMSEVFPLRIRGAGMAAGTVVIYLVTFLVAFTFPVLDAGIGLSYTSLVFAVICVLSFWFVKRYVPETKGRTLEQIELAITANAGRTISLT